MKKTMFRLNLAALALVSVIGMTGCGNTSSVSAEQSTSTETSSSGVDAEIRVTSKVTEVEVGESITIRFTVDTDADDATCNVSCDDESVLSLPDKVTNVVSVVVTGLTVGTANLTIKARANKSVTKTLAINVVAAVPTLRNAMKKIIGLKNYTVNTVNQDESLSFKSIVTENAVYKTYSTASKTDEPLYTSTKGGFSRYGIGIGSDGYATYIDKNTTTGELINPGIRVTTGLGFLDSTNFTGAGITSLNDSDGYGFLSFAALNYTDFVSTKASDNVYTIDGTEDDATSTLVECVLWNMTDPGAFSSCFSDSGHYYYEFAAAITTTITVKSSTDIEIKIATDNDNYEITTISDIGKSAVPTAVSTYLTTATSTAPALTGTVADIQTTLLANKTNYTDIGYAYCGTSYGNVPFKSYRTPNYYFTYYDENVVTKYNTYKGSTVLTVGGEGYYNDNGTVYPFTVTPTTTDGVTTYTVKKEASAGTTTDFPKSAGYIATNDDITGSDLYALSSTAAELFTGYGKFYYTTAAAVVQDMMTYAWGKASTGSVYLGGLNATYDATTKAVTQIDGFVAYGESTSEMYLGFFGFTDFGTADKNFANDAIVAAFAA